LRKRCPGDADTLNFFNNWITVVQAEGGSRNGSTTGRQGSGKIRSGKSPFPYRGDRLFAQPLKLEIPLRGCPITTLPSLVGGDKGEGEHAGKGTTPIFSTSTLAVERIEIYPRRSEA